MIQRKQTVFLLLAIIAIALSFFFPILGLEGVTGKEDLLFNLSAMGGTINGNIGFFIAMLVAFLLDGVAIFAYKTRRTQMKLILVGIVLMAIWYILLAFSINWTDLRLYHWHISSILPLLVVVLNIMAYKGVKKDENLIKSMGRIR